MMRWRPSEGWDLWTLNTWYSADRCPPIIPDKVFQIHKELAPTAGGVILLDIDRVHAAYGAYGTKMVVVKEMLSAFPLCDAAGCLEILDPERLYHLFPYKDRAYFFSSTIAYMLAYAFSLGYAHVRIAGAQMAGEYMYELPGIVDMIRILEVRDNMKIEIEYGDTWSKRYTAELRDKARKDLTVPYIDYLAQVENHWLSVPVHDPWKNGTVDAVAKEIVARRVKPSPSGGVSEENGHCG